MLTALAAESWTWYAITWLIVIIRVISRRDLHGSFRKLQIDDGLMLLAMVTDTILIAAINIVANTSSNLIDPNDTAPLTPASIAEKEYGSKMVLVVEQMQIVTIWLMKACLLIMYSRLTMSLKQNIAVKIAAVYAVLGFAVMEILYFGVWCRPFNQYWAVPPDNVQCSAATNHLITNAVLNISSDVMIIMIPMPVLLQAQLPVKKKAILCCVFALGTFTILAAALNKYYSFNQPFGSEWTFWYIRESSTAIIVTNLPSTWTLCRRVFNLRSFHGKSSGARTSEAAGSRFARSGYGNGRSHISSTERRIITRSESQEQIFHDDGLDLPIPLKIYQQHEVSIKTERIDEHGEGNPKDGHGNVSFASASTPTATGFSNSDITKGSDGKKASSESDSDRSAPGVTTVCTRY
ncbi:integral membrane protein PTH11 [Apiospora kogelbergensis]|uniref:integral membrane protein PTH11 n=1 Tax=Apiospora kogelbergensis TaxID=1337665 RepID=UPI00312FE89C